MSESTSTGDFPEVRCYTLNDYQALRASYDALAARLAEVEAAGVRYTTMTDKNLDRLAAKLEAAEVRVRELEPDAERYRYLRDQEISAGSAGVYFDASIDAARTAHGAGAVQGVSVVVDPTMPDNTFELRSGESRVRVNLDDLHQMDHEDSKT